MVKVIEHGNKNIIGCDFCGAKLKYTTDDINEKECYITQHDVDFIKYIVCPDCKSHIELSKMYMRSILR